MAIHLFRDLENLKKELLLVGALAEEATKKAILTIVDRRRDLSDEVIKGDVEIDQREVRLEEECLKVLALHQPVAYDLRFVMSVLKVNNDLERVGDLAKHLAERGASLAVNEKITIPPEIRELADKVQVMLRDCLSSVVEADTGLAHKILEADEEVDELHANIFKVIVKRIQDHPEQADAEIQMLSVSRYLERIADLATNIAEDVVFMVEGEVIRHQASQPG